MAELETMIDHARQWLADKTAPPPRCACGTRLIVCECGDDRCPKCDPDGCPGDAPASGSERALVPEVTAVRQESERASIGEKDAPLFSAELGRTPGHDAADQFPMTLDELADFSIRCKAWGSFWGPQIAALVERLEALEERELVRDVVNVIPGSWRGL